MARAGRIIAVDVDPSKFKVAEAFGATEFVNPNDHPGKSIQEVIVEMTNGGRVFRGSSFDAELNGF